MSEFSNILVLGADHPIGINLCLQMLQHGFSVKAIVPYGFDQSCFEGLAIDIQELDISKEMTPALFHQVSHVFYFFEKPLMKGIWDEFYRLNVKVLNKALFLSHQQKVSRFIYMSSLMVHDFNGHRHSDEMTAKGSKKTAYCDTKNIAEDLVISYKDYLHVTVVRPGLLQYGPWDHSLDQYYQKRTEEDNLSLVNLGKYNVSGSYIPSFVNGLIRAASSETPSGETFNIIDHSGTWKDFYQNVLKVFESKNIIKPRSYVLSVIGAFFLELCYKLLRLKSTPKLNRYYLLRFRNHFEFSSQKAQELLDFTPQNNIADNLEQTKQWIQKSEEQKELS